MDFNDLFEQTIKNGLCTRCGTCAGICPAGAIDMDDNAYPYLSGQCTKCGFCVNICPGSDLDLPSVSRRIFISQYRFMDVLGDVENHYVSYSTDTAVRFRGASGGVVTGLLIHMLEVGDIDGAIVVAMDQVQPYRSKGILARTATEITNAAQSKYCITPSMEVLREVSQQKGRYAIVALPCQVHALRKMELVDPKLSRKIHCILGLYCNCNLNLNGPREAIEASGIDLAEVKQLKFRERGWPGGLCVEKKNGQVKKLHKVSLPTSMNTMFRLFGADRCYYCVDALAEHADLSFGDFWANDYRADLAALHNCTLISQRTAKGRTILHNAQRDNVVVLQRLPNHRFSQRIYNMGKRKKMRAVVRMARASKRGRPVPTYHLPLPKPSFKAIRSEASYRLWTYFRKPTWRRYVLRFLSTRSAAKFDQINTWRKRYFYRFYDN